MKTLEQLSTRPEMIPAITTWYLTHLAEAKGKQALFLKHGLQRLKALREHAIIESAISSNRIEGVRVDQARVQAVVLGKSRLKDRDEEEVRGYGNAINLIHEEGADLEVSEEAIFKLHRLARGGIWDSGKYKEKESDIVERCPDGRSRVRFKTVEAVQCPEFMGQLNSLWHRAIEEQWAHPLIVVAGFNLDFLCIHPFRDGNGRVSRLLLLLQAYHLGYGVGRYISIERLIEQNKDRYYETLGLSSQGWHEGQHDPWPYVNYILFILKTACAEFEDRLGRLKSPRGFKTELVKDAIERRFGEFTLSDLEITCPGVSRDMIRRVLQELQKQGMVECLGRGPGAPWRKNR
ncbi:MAG: Fic family protein [Deltaproteobacteria bacterium]|nr:Fic family protein [Deltaproteobacteria bacterium]